MNIAKISMIRIYFNPPLFSAARPGKRTVHELPCKHWSKEAINLLTMMRWKLNPVLTLVWRFSLTVSIGQMTPL